MPIEQEQKQNRGINRMNQTEDGLNRTDDTNEMTKEDPNRTQNGSLEIPPINIPIKNRLQTIFILFHSTSIILFGALYFLMWCIPYLWPFMIYYTIFYYLLDRSPVNGGVWYRRSERLRRLGFWKLLVGYFPIKLHKMADLKPTFALTDENEKQDCQNTANLKRVGPKYIFGYHPHGVIATGVSSGLTNNGTNWDGLFPGIKCFVTTLVNQFYVPFYRDYLMALGVTSVVKKNLKLILNKGGSVIIVVGGARESLLAKPGLNSIVLNKRKGFIKLALESLDDEGLCVVPVYGFGENDIYDVFFTDNHGNDNETKPDEKEEGEFELQNNNCNSNIMLKSLLMKTRGLIYNIQITLKNNFGWTVPIVVSRGIFNYDFGILPYRKPINVVVGNPITITRLNGLTSNDEITQYEIDYWHEKYVQELKNVWNWGAQRFSNPSDENLKIVE